MIKQVVAIALLLVGMWAGATVASWMHDDPDAELARNLVRQQQLNDSTAVVLAKERADKRALEGLLTAAKQLNGKLAAALQVKLEIPPAEGVAVGVEEPQAEGTDRVWAFNDTAWVVRRGLDGLATDSARLGIMTARLTAPPFPPQISWRFAVDPIEPSVGFVKVGNRYVATVTCSVCRTVEVEAPFVDGGLKQERRLVRVVGAQYDLVSRDWIGRASVELRLLRGLHVEAGYRQIMRIGEEPRWLIGSSYRF